MIETRYFLFFSLFTDIERLDAFASDLMMETCSYKATLRVLPAVRKKYTYAYEHEWWKIYLHFYLGRRNSWDSSVIVETKRLDLRAV
jgi:hypothetical protein